NVVVDADHVGPKALVDRYCAVRTNAAQGVVPVEVRHGKSLSLNRQWPVGRHAPTFRRIPDAQNLVRVGWPRQMPVMGFVNRRVIEDFPPYGETPKKLIKTECEKKHQGTECRLAPTAQKV